MPTFRRKVLPPWSTSESKPSMDESPSKWRLYVPPNHWRASTGLRGITSPKTVFMIVTVLRTSNPGIWLICVTRCRVRRCWCCHWSWWDHCWWLVELVASCCLRLWISTFHRAWRTVRSLEKTGAGGTWKLAVRPGKYAPKLMKIITGTVVPVC